MTPARKRMLGCVLLTGTLLALGIAWWTARRHSRWEVPQVETRDMAAPVREAVERARAAVLEDPASHAAWYDLGATLQAHALYEAAAVALERAAELRPDDPRPPYLLAILGPTLGFDVERTLGLYTRAAELDPRYPPLHVRRGNALAAAGRLDEARRAHTRAVELDPSFPMAHRQLGLAALDLGDLALALLHLEFGAELEQGDHATWVGLSRAYQQKGWTEKAEMAETIAATTVEVMSYRDSVYEDVLARNVGPLRQLDLAQRYAAGGDHRAAIEALLLAQAGMGETLDIHRRLAASYRELGEMELAEAHEERARSMSSAD